MRGGSWTPGQDGPGYGRAGEGEGWPVWNDPTAWPPGPGERSCPFQSEMQLEAPQPSPLLQAWSSEFLLMQMGKSGPLPHVSPSLRAEGAFRIPPWLRWRGCRPSREPQLPCLLPRFRRRHSEVLGGVHGQVCENSPGASGGEEHCVEPQPHHLPGGRGCVSTASSCGRRGPASAPAAVGQVEGGTRAGKHEAGEGPGWLGLVRKATAVV